jgi:hypothetical protein
LEVAVKKLILALVLAFTAVTVTDTVLAINAQSARAGRPADAGRSRPVRWHPLDEEAHHSRLRA